MLIHEAALDISGGANKKGKNVNKKIPKIKIEEQQSTPSQKYFKATSRYFRIYFAVIFLVAAYE